MKYETIKLQEKGSQDYASLDLYLLADYDTIPIHKRGLVLICPGSGFVKTSKREGEMVAMQFLSKGYHAAVLWYSTYPSLYPASLLELGRSVSLIKKMAEDNYIDPERIFVLGFSAGGYLVCNLCERWNEEWLNNELGISREELKVKGMLLAYPVITAKEYAHKGSFINLLGKDYSELTEEEKEFYSLENHVNKDVPETFMWHTFKDQSVPVMNSVLLLQELIKLNIPCEYHVFENGEHGISLGNKLTARSEGGGVEEECSIWIDLAIRWLERR